MENDIVYKFKTRIKINSEDISLGIMLFNDKNILYGLKGREIGFELNLIFIHIKIGFIRAGHGIKKGDETNDSKRDV